MLAGYKKGTYICIMTNAQNTNTMKTQREVLENVGSQLVKAFRENTDSSQYPLNGKAVLVEAIADADADVWALFTSA